MARKQTIRWEKVSNDHWQTNVLDIGRHALRYYVKKLPRTNKWVAYRHDSMTCIEETSLSEIKKSVENVLNATKGV